MPQTVISNDNLTVYLDRKEWDELGGPITERVVCGDDVRDAEQKRPLSGKMLKSVATCFDASWERPIVTYNTSAIPGKHRMKVV